jgi:predicted metal-dependent hydrolase
VERDCCAALVVIHTKESPVVRVVTGAKVIILLAKLIKERITSLKQANKAALKRKERKKKRIQKQGVLTKGAREDLLAQRKAN